MNVIVDPCKDDSDRKNPRMSEVLNKMFLICRNDEKFQSTKIKDNHTNKKIIDLNKNIKETDKFLNKVEHVKKKLEGKIISLEQDNIELKGRLISLLSK